MIKLLIVDDEPFIRQGIRRTIPWSIHDIEIVGEAGNGKEALALAIQLHPDIVLADIQMPIMDGLELARQLNTFLPETKVMILSAYGNPENFTSAIETKVSRFVLKNANSANILNNVLQVKEEILESREKHNAYLRMNHVYNENQHLIRSTLLTRYLTKQLSVEHFTSKLQKLSLELPGPSYAMLLAECSSSNDWMTISAFQNAFYSCQPFAFFIKDFVIALILNIDKETLTDERLTQILPEIKPYIKANQLALISKINSFEEFPMAYDCLCNCLDACFWNTSQEYSFVSTDYTLQATDTRALFDYEKVIISSVLSNDSTAIDTSIDAYYQFCKKSNLSKQLFLDSIKRLLLLMCAITQEETNMEYLINYFSELETPLEMIDFLKSMARPMIPARTIMPQILEALDYIRENLQNDLHLEDVSKEVCLSPGYLSRIFKLETGYSFKEWLNRVRIEKAKELIAHTNMKYYEIAEAVGYKDYKYFASYFNKFCGYSAKEYKNQCLTSVKSDLQQPD